MQCIVELMIGCCCYGYWRENVTNVSCHAKNASYGSWPSFLVTTHRLLYPHLPPSSCMLCLLLSYLSESGFLVAQAGGPPARYEVLLAVQHGAGMPAFGWHGLAPENRNTVSFLVNVSHLSR